MAKKVPEKRHHNGLGDYYRSYFGAPMPRLTCGQNQTCLSKIQMVPCVFLEGSGHCAWTSINNNNTRKY